MFSAHPGVVTPWWPAHMKALSEGGAALLREGLGGQGVWGRVGLPPGIQPAAGEALSMLIVFLSKKWTSCFHG